jgi:methyltransferase family protein
MTGIRVPNNCFENFGIARIGWLADLSGDSVESIADFGCWDSDESIQLMWTLNATEVFIIEKEENHTTPTKSRLEMYKMRSPNCFSGRSIKFITADMSENMPKLKADYFDLAFCSEVLYNLLLDENLNLVDDTTMLKAAIHQMARIVSPGGLVVACESKVGAKIEKGTDFFYPHHVGEPINIGHFFEAEGLTRIPSEILEDWVYCYRKNKSGG